MKSLLALLFVGLASFACDDTGDVSPDPEPEPEPEAPAQVAAISETRTFDADGALLFRDEYVYIEGALAGFDRYDPSGRTASTWTFETNDDGLLTRLFVADGQNPLFSHDDYNHVEGRTQGFFHRDADGTTVSAFLFDYSTAGLPETLEVVDGPQRVSIDRYAYRDGDPAVVTRHGSAGELMAALTIYNDDSRVTRIEAATSAGISHVVEYDYHATELIVPQPLGIVYPLVTETGQLLPEPGTP